MPVRFVCPACHKLLAITSRKIGSQVQCPKCQSTIIVPDPHDPSTHATLEDDGGQVESVTEIKPPPAPSPTRARQTETPSPVKRGSADATGPTPMDADLFTISRRTIYLQAVLIAVVAVLAFVAGYVIGAAGR
jgi:hypothetical protein